MRSRRAKTIDKGIVVVAALAAVLLLSGLVLAYYPNFHNRSSLSNQSITKPKPTLIASPTQSSSHQKIPIEEAMAKYHVPILMYHYIRIVTDPNDKLGKNLSVTPENFEEQIKWLTENNYQTFPLSDFCHNQIPTEKKPIILTFDDGHDDAYTTALPILQKYNQTGTFFIIKGFLNRPEFMNTEQLQLLEDSGMETGAHTVNHIDLKTASLAKQKSELEGSKQSSPVLAYPSGMYSQETIKIARGAGYICAVTTNPGIATEKSLLFELPRVRISGGENMESFIKSVKGFK